MQSKIKFRQLVKEIKTLEGIRNLLSWDLETEAPRKAHPERGPMMAFLSQEIFDRLTSPEYIQCVNELSNKQSKLDSFTKREVHIAKKDLDKMLKIPKEEYVAYQVLLSDTQLIWEDAKANNDFASFEPNLAKIIEYQKKFITYYESPLEPYDVLLDDFEEGMNMKIYDEFFDVLKTDLVPFVKDLLAKNPLVMPAFAKSSYDVSQQEEFSEQLLDVFGFDRQAGVLKTSVHPFTWNTSSHDVRLTTRYEPDQLFSAIFSTIHELGHALYEQHIDPTLNETFLAGGASMGMHESQSRMFENIFGRSKEFWTKQFPKLKNRYRKQLKDVSFEAFIQAINHVEASLIRVEADELTYPLHILIRYELERKLFAGELQVHDLPQAWNQAVEDHLGIRPNNDSEGVLQDIHWSAGLFGYFPTYALGSAIAAQIYYTMKKEFDVEKALRQHNFKKINAWLTKKIHRHGKRYTANEMIEAVCQEPFNPQFYVKYLKEKYTALFLNESA